MIHLDFNGKQIYIGQCVVYTSPGAYRNLPPLALGEVIKLTKAGVTVRKLNKDFTYETYNAGHWDSGYSKWVDDGIQECPPENVRWYENRFLIVDRP